MEKSEQSSKGRFSLLGTPVMIDGLKAEYHVNKWTLKRKQCPFDAGMDLYLDRSEPQVSPMKCSTIFRCGTCIQITLIPGMYGFIVERSSSMAKLEGGSVKVGIIDPGYTGEIFVGIIAPYGCEHYVLDAIKQLQKDEVAVAQMIFHQYAMPIWTKPDPALIRQMGRGTNGFGHTDLIGT